MNQISSIQAAWREDPRWSLPSYKCFWWYNRRVVTSPNKQWPPDGCVDHAFPRGSDPLIFHWTVRENPICCPDNTSDGENRPSYDFLTCSDTDSSPHLRWRGICHILICSVPEGDFSIQNCLIPTLPVNTADLERREGVANCKIDRKLAKMMTLRAAL